MQQENKHDNATGSAKRTYISFNNRWVRLDGESTAWLLELIDHMLVADEAARPPPT